MERNAEVVLSEIPSTIVLELRGNVDRDMAGELTAAYERGCAHHEAHAGWCSTSPPPSTSIRAASPSW